MSDYRSPKAPNTEWRTPPRMARLARHRGEGSDAQADTRSARRERTRDPTSIPRSDRVREHAAEHRWGGAIPSALD